MTWIEKLYKKRHKRKGMNLLNGIIYVTKNTSNDQILGGIVRNFVYNLTEDKQYSEEDLYKILKEIQKTYKPSI